MEAWAGPMINTYRDAFAVDLYRMAIWALACVLLPLCVVVGITLGLQAGRDIGEICNRNRDGRIAARVVLPAMPMQGARK